MNVKDFDIPIPEGDMLVTIFNRQRELMNTYHKIEENNVGHLLPYTSNEHGEYCGALNIDDRASQLRIKEFAWFITEELTEATLALAEEDRVHFEEELIDALHFSVEIMILSGIKPVYGTGDAFQKAFDSVLIEKRPAFLSENLLIKIQTYQAIEKLGEAMNRLKLKSWKTTAMLTDREAYNVSISDFFKNFIALLKLSGFTARTATAMYLNKHAVNQFRQLSNY